MHIMDEPADVLRRLVEWAIGRNDVRAVLLMSSRAKPTARVDMFSDYDVLLAVMDIRALYTERSWLSDFGRVLVTYWDPIEADPQHGIEQTGNVIQYADGLHFDFRLWPVQLLRAVVQTTLLPAELDDGYTVPLDKDLLCRGMQPPSYRAYIPTRPTEHGFQQWIEEFFSDVPYVAKCLWRDELLPGK